MQRRSTRKGELVILSNQQLREIERSNRAAKRARSQPSSSHSHSPPSISQSNQATPPPNAEPMDQQPQQPQNQNPNNGFPADLPPELVAHFQAWLQQQGGEVQQMRQELHQLRNERQAPPAQQPRARTIGESDAPHLHYQNQSPIVPPPIDRRDYDIKPQLIALVQSKQFHGLPNENPMNHIETFERFCKTTIANGVTYDYIMCILFPFSLAGKGERWLNSLPPASLRTWNEVRNAFLDYFFTKGKTALLRNKIITFTQKADESFKEAWDRYKEYRRDCPHHGYSDDQILRFFYDGLTFEYRMALDAASNGDFNTQSVDGAFQLMENMAQSSHKKCAEFDRTIRTPTLIPTKTVLPQETLVAQMEAQMEELLQLFKSQKEVSMIAEDNPYQEPEKNPENSEEVNYVNGQGFGQNRGYNFNQRSNPLLSWRSNNVANPQDQQYPPQERRFNQGYQNQQQNANNPRWNNQYQQGNQGFPQKQPQGYNSDRAFYDEFRALITKGNEEVQRSIKNLTDDVAAANAEHNARFTTLETRLRMAEMQVAQTAELAKRQHGTLPGKGEQNPRKDVCLVRENPVKTETTREDAEKEEQPQNPEEGVTVVEKLEDPGKVTLSVEIQGEVFPDCLCDLGSSVNLISHAAAQNLGITTYEPTDISLRFADRSEKKPLGVLEDVPVVLDKTPIPTDFVVLELGEESKDAILLGRPFLCTAGAVIDVRKKSIDLHLGSRKTGKGTIPFDPGAEKTRNKRNDPSGSQPEQKTLEKALFEESDVFAGTQRSGPDKPDSIRLFDCLMPGRKRSVQVNSCTGLGSLTRPPDKSPQ